VSFLSTPQLKNCGGGLNDVVSAEPYCAVTVLTPEDSYILMACDGVWDVLTDQEAMDFMIAKVATYEDQVKEAKRKGVAVNGEEKMEDVKAADGAAVPAASPTPAASSSASGNSAVTLTQSDWNEVLHLTSKALVREALDRRSLDNVTVLIIKL
jgi:serine/threonine protein phosphatase PrpC